MGQQCGGRLSAGRGKPAHPGCRREFLGKVSRQSLPRAMSGSTFILISTRNPHAHQGDQPHDLPAPCALAVASRICGLPENGQRDHCRASFRSPSSKLPRANPRIRIQFSDGTNVGAALAICGSSAEMAWARPALPSIISCADRQNCRGDLKKISWSRRRTLRRSSPRPRPSSALLEASLVAADRGSGTLATRRRRLPLSRRGRQSHRYDLAAKVQFLRGGAREPERTIDGNACRVRERRREDTKCTSHRHLIVQCPRYFGGWLAPQRRIRYSSAEPVHHRAAFQGQPRASAVPRRIQPAAAGIKGKDCRRARHRRRLHPSLPWTRPRRARAPAQSAAPVKSSARDEPPHRRGSARSGVNVRGRRCVRGSGRPNSWRPTQLPVVQDRGYDNAGSKQDGRWPRRCRISRIGCATMAGTAATLPLSKLQRRRQRQSSGGPVGEKQRKAGSA